jgi:hypothetical protein
MRGRAIVALAFAALCALSGRAGAQLPGVSLSVTPQSLSFNNVQARTPVAAAQQELTVRVLTLGRQPWRLTVTALGNLLSSEGDQIPIQQVSYKGNPAAVFSGGALIPGQPVLVGQGQGSKEGILRFILENRWEYAAGHYSVRLLFTITSP